MYFLSMSTASQEGSETLKYESGSDTELEFDKDHGFFLNLESNGNKWPSVLNMNLSKCLLT